MTDRKIQYKIYKELVLKIFNKKNSPKFTIDRLFLSMVNTMIILNV